MLPLSFSWHGGPRESECPVEQCHSLCTLLGNVNWKAPLQAEFAAGVCLVSAC